DEHDFAREDRGFALDDAPLLNPRVRLGVALHEIDPAADDFAFFGENTLDRARLPFVVAADDDDLVAFTNASEHQRTSGASEMIFMNFLPRSSRATGPKIRVPIGSSCGGDEDGCVLA